MWQKDVLLKTPEVLFGSCGTTHAFHHNLKEVAAGQKQLQVLMYFSAATKASWSEDMLLKIFCIYLSCMMVTLIGVGVRTQFADIVLHLQVRWSHVEFRRMSRCNKNKLKLMSPLTNQKLDASVTWWK